MSRSRHPPTLAGCPDDAIADGIRYAADHGAKVINLSLGGAGSSEALRDALLYAVSKGAFVAISAGNDFEEGNAIEYPAAYAPRSTASCRSARSAPRARGRTTRARRPAPRLPRRAATPDRAGRASLIWQASHLSDPTPTPGVIVFPRFDGYTDTAEQGTSMASPHVAGLAALLTSRGVTNPAAVEALIKATATDLGAPGPRR